MLKNQAARGRRAIVGSALPLLSAALTDLLQVGGFTVAASLTDASEARDALLGNPPDLAVFDFAGQEPSGLDLLRDARSAGIATRMILLCGSGDEEASLDAVELGVDGLLRRTATLDTVGLCIATVARGEQWLDTVAMRDAYERMARRQSAVPTLLTKRERDVARLVAAGQRNRIIAVELGISEGTVKMHLHNVYAKMGLESRTQLAMDARIREIA